MDIFEIDGQLYLTVDGKFSVYIWQNERWSHHYKGKYFGYNYFSKPFIGENTIYSYGGYGFWRFHGDIIRYMPERREWEIIPESQPLPFAPACLCQDTLLLFDEKSLAFNLGQKRIVKDQTDSRPHIPFTGISNTVELSNWCLIIYGASQYILLDKRDRSIWQSQLKPFDGIRNGYASHSFVHLIGDSMSIFYLDGSIYNYTVDKELGYFTRIVKPRFFHRPISWALSFLAVIIAIAVFFRLRQKMETPASEGHDPVVQGLISAFESRKGETLSVNEIDKVLRIDHVRIAETRRFRRSKYIKAINDTYQSAHGSVLIERKKDPSDRRKYVYMIR
jgi:hypothetical protein